MKRLFEKYPPEDLGNLNTYIAIMFIMVLIAEIWKAVIVC